MAELTAAGRRINEGTTPIYEMGLLDEDGAPISSGSFSAVKLTLYVKSTPDTIINSRDAQSILNANQGVVVANLTITGATSANPVVITVSDSDHELQTGDKVHLSSISGMTQLNLRTFTVTRLTATTFSLNGEDGTGHTAYTSGGSGRTGKIIWAMVAADTALQGTVRDDSIEEHIALFEWTYGSSKEGKAEVQFDIVSMDQV